MLLDRHPQVWLLIKSCANFCGLLNWSEVRGKTVHIMDLDMILHLLFFLSDYKINFEVAQLGEKVLGAHPKATQEKKNVTKWDDIWFVSEHIIVDMRNIIFYHGINVCFSS